MVYYLAVEHRDVALHVNETQFGALLSAFDNRVVKKFGASIERVGRLYYRFVLQQKLAHVDILQSIHFIIIFMQSLFDFVVQSLRKHGYLGIIDLFLHRRDSKHGYAHDENIRQNDTEIHNDVVQ